MDETDVGKLALGQGAEVTAEAYPGRVFLGKIIEIGQAVGKREVTPEDPAKIQDMKGLETKIEVTEGNAVHFASTNERHEMVSTLRLVLDSPLGFPLEHHAGTLSEEFQRLPRGKTAEISRLILAKSYRRRANDGLYGEELGDPEKEAAARAEASYKRSQYPLILFGLFKEMYMESLSRGLEYWLAAMEPGLQKMLSKFGLGLKQMGDPMSYYGEVIPYYASIEELTRFVMESRPDVFQFFGQPSS